MNKKLIIILLYILTISNIMAMDMVQLNEIINSKDITKTSNENLKIFGISGEYKQTLTITIHEQNKTLNVPEHYFTTKIIENDYLVITQPMPQSESYYWVIKYNNEDNIFQKWEITPEKQINIYVGMKLKSVDSISWTSINKSDNSNDLIIESYNGNRCIINAITYQNGKKKYTMEAQIELKTKKI